MRAAFVTSACMLGACSLTDNHPELVACEEYAKATLRSPATFNRIRAYISDERMPEGYWQARERSLFGGSSKFSDLYRTYAKEGGIRTVVIEYDAANAYGTPIRGVEACKFELKSFSEDDFSTDPDATSSKLDLMTVQAGVQPDTDDLGCCMSRADLRLAKRFQKNAQFVGQKVID